ncbi:MAG TPA: murein biosynthesis integral membrane protein MurJ [bacterium]|nr:murein biosynthesis integral membrane protein MurJ [bacterium]
MDAPLPPPAHLSPVPLNPDEVPAQLGLPSHGRLARAASLMAIATVASRILGLVREIVTAWLFGATQAKAAYVIAYYLPFFVQRLLLGGTLSIIFIPTLSRYLARNDLKEAQRVSGNLFSLVFAVGAGMVAAGYVLAPLLVPIAAPGFTSSAELVSLTVRLTRIIFIAMLFLALAVYLTGFLQAHNDFTVAALSPVAFNIPIIAGTLVLGPRIGIEGLAIAWIAGTAMQFLVQLPAARRYGLRLGRIDVHHPGVRDFGRLAVPAVLGLAILEINAYVGRSFASLLAASPSVSPVAVLDYAYGVVQAPAGIFAISIATAVFPLLSRHAASGSHADLRATASLAWRTVLFVILPVTALMVVLRVPLVTLIFQRGQFTPQATQAVAAALLGYTVGLPAIAGSYVVTRTYYALQDMQTPVRIGSVMVVLNALLAYALMRPWGVGGIALAASIVSMLNVGLLLWRLRQRLGRFDGRQITSSLLRSGLAALVTGAAGAAVATLVRPHGLAGYSLQVGAALVAGGVAYLGACSLLQVTELHTTWALLRRPAR